MVASIGIDLGTTSSRVAVMRDGKAVIIENSEGEGTTPSYVGFPEGGPRLVGEAARRYAVTAPENVVFAVKRLIGRAYSDPVVQELKRFMPFQIVESTKGDAWIEVGGKKYAPDQITAYILQKMRHTAEQYLGEPISQAVITVPAYFNDQQRQSTKDAAEIAGLQVLRLESEPTMAALTYGAAHPDGSQMVAVYDLGGGTFDISIIEIGDGVYEVKSTNGDMFLGGEDFDLRIVEHLAEAFKTRHGIDLLADPIARQRLKQAAESTKISLSSALAAHIDLPFIYSSGGNSLHLSMDIKRDEFEKIIDDIIVRSVEVCRAALKDAALKPEQIDQVVLVGGSTRIPSVQRHLRTFFGRAPYGGLRREDAVALGAAISAGIMTGQVKDSLLLDVTPHSLGIETLGGFFTRLIDRNTSIPTRKSQVFSTAEDNQEAVTLCIYQGEQEKAADNRLLGQFDLTGLRPAPRATPQIEVTFDIDRNIIVSVSAKDKDTGKEQQVRLQASGGLSKEELARMRQDAEESGISEQQIVNPVDILGSTPKILRTESVEPPATHVQSPQAAAGDLPDTAPISIFLSYAHEDEKLANAIVKALALLKRTKKATIWHDRKISVGTDWERSIFREIEQSNIAILLISNDFFNSDFILERELPAILAEKERRQLQIVPIMARPCPIEQDGSLSKFQHFNDPDSPLSSLSEHLLEVELVRLARHLAGALT